MKNTKSSSVYGKQLVYFCCSLAQTASEEHKKYRMKCTQHKDGETANEDCR